MRIAFIDWMCDPSRPGTSGLSDITWALARRLAATGDEVHVFGPYTVVPASEGVHVHRFPLPPIAYRNVLGHILIVLRGLSYVRRLGPWTAIHAPEYLTTAIVAPLMAKTPVVLTVPGNIFERIDNVNHFDWVMTQAYKLAARASARRCAAIIATSDEQAYWWRFSGADQKRIATIPLGVDTSLFRPGAPQSSERRRLLFVGRLQGENGCTTALHAFALAHRRHPQLSLTIVGDGPERPALGRLAEALEIGAAITWRISVPFNELPSVYQSADLFLFPRRSRVTPRVLFEALACGLPSVTSAIGGIVDFIHHGETGLLAEPDDAAAFAEQIIALVDDADLASAISRQARAYACRELDWSVIVNRLRTEVYQPLENHGALQPGVRSKVKPMIAAKQTDHFEYVACCLCGSDTSQPVIVGHDRNYGVPGAFQVVRCRTCGLTYSNPRVRAEVIGEYYPPHYGPHTRSVPTVGRPKRWDRWKRSVKQAVADSFYYGRPTAPALRLALLPFALWLRLMRVILLPSPLGKEARLLDVGCASGHNLAELVDVWPELYGVEPDHEAAALAAQVPGLHITAGTLEEAAFPDGFFEVVTLWHVLEHVHDPVALLREIRRVLKPGGYLVLMVPNIATVEFALFGEHWMGLDVPRHLYHFSPHTLRQAIAAAGMLPLRVTQQIEPALFEASLRNRFDLPRRVAGNAWWRLARPLFRAASFAAAQLGTSGIIAAYARRSETDL